MHEMFLVMCTAFECTSTNPDALPCMSEVLFSYFLEVFTSQLPTVITLSFILFFFSGYFLP